MNKKLAIACAVGALCGAAQAQSNVTMFGVFDIGMLSARATGSGGITSVNTDGNTSSRLGFRGVEDLGGGMKADFWLEAAHNPDTGTGGSTSVDNRGSVNSGGLTFARRSTVGLSGGFGELRLGRDYTPTFTNLTVAVHPFGTNGVGNAGQLFYPVAAGGTTARTNVRASNAINYFTPEMGGFSANIMYAVGEQPSAPALNKDDGNYFGGRLAYRNGPLTVAAATGKTKYATGDYTQSNLGVVYQMGPARLTYMWGENKVGITKTKVNLVGVQFKVSPAGEVRAAYTDLKATGVASNATQIAVGYLHNLSKRTALYTNYSVVDNKGTGTSFSVGNGIRPTTAGGNSTGFEVGIRHSF
jgi:predicted porin